MWNFTSSVFMTVGERSVEQIVAIPAPRLIEKFSRLTSLFHRRVFVTVGVADKPRHPQLFSAITFESQRAVRRSPASAEMTAQVEVSALGSHQMAVPGQRRTQNPR